MIFGKEWTKLSLIYQNMSKEMAKYIRCETGAPKEIKDRYKIALHDLHDYLDNHSMKMPPPNYAYSVDDKSTWYVVDCNVHSSSKGMKFGGYIKNPKFKYFHLLESTI